MNRILIGLTLTALLAACTAQEGGTIDEPIGSAPMGSPDASTPAMSDASPACEEAFAPIADMEVASLSDLGDLQAELQPTIETCESIDDWIAGAQTVLDEEVNPATARLLLGIQCNDPTLSNTAVCEELASS
jgi:hypothetical protein